MLKLYVQRISFPLSNQDEIQSTFCAVKCSLFHANSRPESKNVMHIWLPCHIWSKIKRRFCFQVVKSLAVSSWKGIVAGQTASLPMMCQILPAVSGRMETASKALPAHSYMAIPPGKVPCLILHSYSTR